ncbi:hypothetical protein N7461_002079 [Penicillium sp. DV-2018c]|nr:hypothetical protein N7461_002079 [Penicillium sp. DV-2018c]
MATISADQPRRGRRSSISEHIHRVFGNKSSDKRHSSQSVSIQPAPTREALANKQTTGDNASYVRHSLYDKTGPSSISHSSINSRPPSNSTPGFSISVAPVGSTENGTSTQQMSPHTTSRPDVGRENKSPTRYQTKKKEKRVSRRLEAERKELEKRLLALEEAQSKSDLGIYERSPRRLTKKQPVSTSSRSSSANTERPRSSSRLSSIFRRSRRNSTSSDLDSQSTEFSRLRNDTHPPSLPLTLPERFGTAITRELQSTHGAALDLSASNRSSHPTQNRSLHTATKSDDLRENWRMAEAWKTKVDGRQSTRSVSEQIPQGSRSMVGNGARTDERPVTSPAVKGDLDRELFSAALKHDRKGVLGTERASERVAPYDRSVRAISMPMPRSLTQPDLHQPYLNSPTQVSTAHQSLEILPPEAPDYSSSQSSSRSYLPLNPAQTNATGSFARKTRVEQSPRAYKSSPLALNTVNTNESPQKASMIPKAAAVQDIISPIPLKPPQASVLSQSEDRGRSRLPVAVSSGNLRTSTLCLENSHGTSQETKPPEIPIKSERRTQENWRIKTPSDDESLGVIPVSPFQPSVRSPFHTGSVSPSGRNKRRSRDMSDGTSVISARAPRRASRVSNESPNNILAFGGLGAFIPGHSRPSSHGSSHDEHSSHDNDGHSNYDTADEDTPESPGLEKNSLTQVNSNPVIVNPPIETPAAQQAPVSQPMQTNISPGIQPDTHPSTRIDTFVGNQPEPSPSSPQTRTEPTSIQKRRSEKPTEPRKPPPIIKLFVICCRCKYWHNLPPEVYARLACLERRGPESKLSRALSKKGNDSGSRKLIGLRPLPFGQSSASRAAQDAPDLHPAPLLPRKVTCCWCGHNMSRSCCEGWTAVVEMRERHH